MAPKSGGLYKLDPSVVGQPSGKGGLHSHTTSSANQHTQPFLHSCSNNFAANKAAAVGSLFDILHARLGHTSLSKMKHIAEYKSHIADHFFCEICVLAKSHRLPFHKSSISTHSPFELVHMYLWGPYRTANITRAHFFSL